MPGQIIFECVSDNVPQIAFMLSGKRVGRVNQIVWEGAPPVVGDAVPVAYRGASGREN